MTKKPHDDTPAIVRIQNINVSLLTQYNGQEATVAYSFNIGSETFASVICADGKTLMLNPSLYEVISGTLTPQSSSRMRNRPVQQIRMNKAAGRYAKRARSGRTQQY